MTIRDSYRGKNRDKCKPPEKVINALYGLNTEIFNIFKGLCCIQCSWLYTIIIEHNKFLILNGSNINNKYKLVIIDIERVRAYSGGYVVYY